MESTTLKERLTKLTIIFLVVYASFWLMPSIIIFPIDFIIEIITKTKIVDGWTYGVMVWLYTVIGLPIMYLIVILSLIYKAKKNA